MSSESRKLIVVLGMHRSGTSAIAGLLANLGINMGSSLIPAGPDNEKGFWEDAGIVSLNDQILSTLGRKWSDCRPIHWSDQVQEKILEQWGDRAESLLEELYSGDNAICAVKDPRFARLLPFWKAVFERLQLGVSYIWVLRTPNGVVQSLQARNRFSLDKSVALWLTYNQSIAVGMKDIDALLLEYDRAMCDESSTIDALFSFLSVDRPDEYQPFFDTGLRHCQDAFSEQVIEENQLVGLAEQVYEKLNQSFSVIGGGEFDETLHSNCNLLLEANAQHLDLLSDMAEEASCKEEKWLQQQQDKLLSQLEDLNGKYEERAVYINRLETERHDLLNQIESERFELRSEQDRLVDKIHTIEAELTETAAEANALAEKVPGLQHELEEAHKDVDIKRGEIGELWQHINHVTKQRDDLEKTVGEILASRSWRLMAWYRFSARAARKLIRLPRGAAYYLYNALSKQFIKFHQLGFSRNNIEAINQLAGWRPEALDGLRHAAGQNQPIPEIDLTVVTYNSEGWLDSFFASLLDQNYPLEKINLLFTDNSSSDDTREKLLELKEKHEQRFSQISIEQQPNIGFGAGHDHAIRRSSSEFILVTNVDLEFSAEAIPTVVRQALADDRKTVSWELRQQPFEHPKYYDPVTLDTSWSSHACVLMRREAYVDVGGYEPKIFMYGEDVELSYRYRRAGYRIKYVPAAVVSHFTYEFEAQVKPLQFFGSTLANAYIRLRYGDFFDVVGIVGLYIAALTVGGHFPGARRGLLKNFCKVLVNAPYFISSRKKPVSEAHFPFHFWDYEMVRDGAFYQGPRVATDERPLVTVVTRTYVGREDGLKEAMASVLNQVYPYVEMIVVEDGGDTQEQLVEKYKPLFRNGKTIRFYAQPKNGRSYNGNVGLSLAEGEYIMFLDDDDLLFPDHIEVLMQELLACSEYAAAYALSWEVLTRTMRDGSRHYYEEMFNTPDIFKQEFSHEVIQKHNLFPIQAVLFHRRLFEKYGGFDVEMDQLEDWNLWVRYSSESEFKYVPKTTSLYRTPYNTVERARRHQQLHDSYEVAVNKQKVFLESLGT